MKGKKLCSIVTIVLIFSITLTVYSKSLSNDKGLFWKVTNKNSTVYLLGSFHSLKQGMFKFNKQEEAAFEKANSVYFESDISAPFDIGTVSYELNYTVGDDLFNHISKEGAKKISTYYKEVGLDVNKCKQNKIWYLMLPLLSVQSSKLGYDSKYGVENYVYEKAKGKKKIAGLESYRYMFELYSSMSDEEQEKDLFTQVRDLKGTKTYLDDTYKMCASGDVKKLGDSLGTYKKASPAGYNLTIVKRNINFTNGIDKLLKTKGTYFVVIGSMHYIGDDSIIKMLEKEVIQLNG